MKKDDGYSTAFGMIIIFILCFTIMALSMLVFAKNKKINKYENLYEKRNELIEIMYKIESDFQNIVDISNDNLQMNEFIKIFEKYEAYNIQIRDVSTGINPSVLSKEFLENESINNYIKNKNQLCDYGWINNKYASNSVLEKLKVEFESNFLFPLVNNLPMYNIFFMDYDFLYTMLSYVGIPNSEKKAREIIAILDYDINSLNKENLCKILQIKNDHKIFEIIGFKSNFWEVKIQNEIFNSTIIFAGVPKNIESKIIEKYIPIKTKFERRDLSHENKQG
nr:hypothetical protein [Clostridia bacterium]